MSTETKTDIPAETTEEKPKKANKTSAKKTSVKKSKK